MPKIIKVAKGSYTATDITVDSSGRVITASSGSGATNMALTNITLGPASGTFTAQPGTSKINIFIRGGGGAGGQDQGVSCGAGKGGMGGFGLFTAPVTQPYGVPYSLGAGGNVGGQNDAGGSGAASTFADNLTANGGGGGQRCPTPAASGSPGNAPGGIADYSQPTNDLLAVYYVSEPIGSASANATAAAMSQAGGGGVEATAGGVGAMKVYEDIG